MVNGTTSYALGGRVDQVNAIGLLTVAVNWTHPLITGQSHTAKPN